MDLDPDWKWITAEEIAHAFDVPPALLGISTPVSSVLIPAECPANTSPYVPDHLGINAMLVHQSQPPLSPAWKGKTSAEILADVHAAIAAYKGEHPMPKKVFQSGPLDPDNPMSVMAHEVFTSPLIHSHEQAVEAGKQVLSAHGVKIAKADGQGNWVDVGGIESMSLSLDYAEGLENMAKVEPHLSQIITEATLKQQAAVELQTIGTFIGMDLGPDSGVTVTVAKAQADAHGALQISVYGPGGEPVKQATLDQDVLALALAQAYATAPLPPIQIGTPWHHGWGYQEKVADVTEVTEDDHGVSFTGKLVASFPEIPTETKKQPYSMHASGLAMDFNAPPSPSHIHFNVQAEGVSTAEPDLLEDEDEPLPHLIDLMPMATEARVWCQYHAMHYQDPVHQALAGSTFECGAWTWTRTSTPLEDKQVIAKIKMMEDQGLM